MRQVSSKIAQAGAPVKEFIGELDMSQLIAIHTNSSQYDLLGKTGFVFKFPLTQFTGSMIDDPLLVPTWNLADMVLVMQPVLRCWTPRELGYIH